MTKKPGYFYFVVRVFVCLGIALVLFYVAKPKVPPEGERLKLHQQIGPFAYVDTQVSVILQGVVDSASRALTVKVCKTLANERITIAAETPQTMEAVLKEISRKLGCELQVFSGSAAVVQPVLLCPRGTSAEQETVIIEKK